ncbi:hypothetical protein FE840_017525 (plasmid) [Peteryoungia desertarenae]|uniref:Uncharacterized protein n=1 Tax=Peteryoungia desertarenae TaxID=1813451 RepID=A0ABX6QTD4_9HYPH|nr:hypothetical protein [Peteryoungia desertarenae]QLF71475.1 hypothetical protein FE840_017525 [Peteryoungia desertarenae]
MKSWLTLAAFCLVLGAAPAWSQSLYLGDLELDTGERQLMTTVLRICNTLARAEQDRGSGTVDTPPVVPGQMTPSRETRLQVPELAIDSLSSADNGSQAAGEGSGTGVTSNGSFDQSDADQPDLSKISLSDCRQAGLVY